MPNAFLFITGIRVRCATLGKIKECIALYKRTLSAAGLEAAGQYSHIGQNAGLFAMSNVKSISRHACTVL